MAYSRKTVRGAYAASLLAEALKNYDTPPRIFVGNPTGFRAPSRRLPNPEGFRLVSKKERQIMPFCSKYSDPVAAKRRNVKE